jgi:hypothetical protein
MEMIIRTQAFIPNLRHGDQVISLNISCCQLFKSHYSTHGFILIAKQVRRTKVDNKTLILIFQYNRMAYFQLVKIRSQFSSHPKSFSHSPKILQRVLRSGIIELIAHTVASLILSICQRLLPRETGELSSATSQSEVM